MSARVRGGAGKEGVGMCVACQQQLQGKPDGCVRACMSGWVDAWDGGRGSVDGGGMQRK